MDQGDQKNLRDTLIRRLVPTRLGPALLNARSRIKRRKVSASLFPEGIASMAQECCSRFLMTRMAARNELFVDLGAHIGSVLAEVISNNRGVRLIAIEAIAEKATSLKRLFPSVTVLHSAVGESVGVVEFSVRLDRSGFSSICATEAERLNPAVRMVRVPLRPLDDLLASTQAPSVVKIDVEGAELGVLRGADRTIGKSRPVVFFESGPGGGRKYGYPDNGVYRWFAERGFEVTIPDRLPHDAPGVSEETFLDAHCYPRRSGDFVAIPAEKREHVRERCRQVLRDCGAWK